MVIEKAMVYSDTMPVLIKAGGNSFHTLQKHLMRGALGKMEELGGERKSSGKAARRDGCELI
ncbi:MAG: hypothetical protein AB1611_11730 [bacterium]